MNKGFTHESPYPESMEWYTPGWIFEKLDITFDMDPASPGSDIVPWVPAATHLTPYDDGLATDWKGKVWLNPPYGGETPKWLSKMAEYRNGIVLVFSRTDTNWFHNYAINADAICFIKGRINFVKAEHAGSYSKQMYIPTKNPGCGSMLLAFGKNNVKAIESCGLGWVVINGVAVPPEKPIGLFEPHPEVGVNE